MAKITLTDLEAGYGLKTSYNANNDAITAAIENSLARDGTTPNHMLAQIDMNSYRIINLADGIDDLDAVNVRQLVDGVRTYLQNELDYDVNAGVGLTGGGSIDTSPTIDLDISGLTTSAIGEVAGTDGYLVDDGGVMKRIAYNDAHIRVVTEAGTTDTLADTDCNSLVEYTSGDAVTVTLPVGVGGVGSTISLLQYGAGRVTVEAGAGVTLRAPNGALTAQQYSMAYLFCRATDEWILGGDTAAA